MPRSSRRGEDVDGGQHVAYAHSGLDEDPQLDDVLVWDRAGDELNIVSWPESAGPSASRPSITG